MAITFATESFASTSQNHINKGVASNFYPKVPILAVLGALTLGNQKKDSLSIGRPGSGEILSGGMVGSVERKKLGTINEYIPRAQGFETDNSVELDTYDDMPDVADADTRAHSQATNYGAGFRWGEIVTPIYIWNEDLIRCLQEGTKEGVGIAATQKIEEATEVAYQDHIKKLNANIWTGNPANQNAYLWKGVNASTPGACLGIIEMTKTDNTYGRVNRSTSGNEIWQSNVDSTLTSVDIQRIVDDVKYTKGLSTKGDGPYLVITNTGLYQTFKAQVKASHGIGEVMPAGLPEMAKMGVRKEVLRVDDAYVIYDPYLGTGTGTYANTVVVLDLSTIKFMVHPQRNFKVFPFVDLSDRPNEPDAKYAKIRTRFMFTNDNPWRSARYTAIGT